MNSSYLTIKLLIADDYELVRIGLRTIFEMYNDLVLLQDASDGQQAIDLSLKYIPDVVLMDLKMPIKSGIEAAIAINQENPKIKIILITAHEDDVIKIKNFPGNVKGFLIKDIVSDDLINIIRLVNNGQYVFSRKILANYLEFRKYIDDNNLNYIVLKDNPFD